MIHVKSNDINKTNTRIVHSNKSIFKHYADTAWFQEILHGPVFVKVETWDILCLGSLCPVQD